jgi:hypothetical protein
VFPEALESIRWKIDVEGVPKTLVLGRPAKAPGSYYGDDKAKPIIARFMAPRSSRVRIEGMGGVVHTVEVTAITLIEGVAQGLELIRKEEWAAEIPEGLNTIKDSSHSYASNTKSNCSISIAGL